jgi:hypothetical protein
MTVQRGRREGDDDHEDGRDSASLGGWRTLGSASSGKHYINSTESGGYVQVWAHGVQLRRTGGYHRTYAHNSFLPFRHLRLAGLHTDRMIAPKTYVLMVHRHLCCTSRARTFPTASRTRIAGRQRATAPAAPQQPGRMRVDGGPAGQLHAAAAAEVRGRELPRRWGALRGCCRRQLRDCLPGPTCARLWGGPCTHEGCVRVRAPLQVQLRRSTTGAASGQG